MSSKTMSLKAKINNYAKKNNIVAQVVLQNYMFEKFLERLSISEYQEKFVIKGGMLIAAIVGLDTRSTMDLDTTLKNIQLTEEEVQRAISTISDIDLHDEVKFEMISILPIRNDDAYGGFCVRINAIFDTIVTPLSIDVTAGDIITPKAIQYELNGIFDKEVKIKLWGYNIETVMAEKVEAILSLGIFSTRPRDYYDVYILTTTQEFDKELFEEALKATMSHRGSSDRLAKATEIIEMLAVNDDMKEVWRRYQKRFPYAQKIEYEKIIVVLKKLIFQ